VNKAQSAPSLSPIGDARACSPLHASTDPGALPTQNVFSPGGDFLAPACDLSWTAL